MPNKKTTTAGMISFHPTNEEWEMYQEVDWTTKQWDDHFSKWIIVIEDKTHIHIAFCLKSADIGLDCQNYRKNLFKWYFEWNNFQMKDLKDSRIAFNIKWETKARRWEYYAQYVLKGVDPEIGITADGQLICKNCPEAEYERAYELSKKWKNAKVKLLGYNQYVDAIFEWLDDQISEDDTIKWENPVSIEHDVLVGLATNKILFSGSFQNKSAALKQTIFAWTIINREHLLCEPEMLPY